MQPAALAQKPRLYVLGSPRSGSTWLADRIGMHRAILARHEPDIVRRGTLPHLIRHRPDTQEIDIYRSYLNDLAICNAVRATARPKVQSKAFRGPLRDRLWYALAYTGKAFCRVVPRASNHLTVPDLIAQPDALKAVLIKTVSMLGRSAYLQAALRAEDRVIILLRDPYASTASVLAGARRGIMPKPVVYDDWHLLDIARDRGWSVEDMRAMDDASIIATGWVGFNDLAFVEFKDDARAMIVRHHDLVRRDPALLKRINDHVGFEVDFGDAPSAGTHVDQGYFSTNKSSADILHRWKDVLRAADIEAITAVIADSPAARLFTAE